MTSGQERYFIPSSYSRIVARELGLQERELSRLLHGTGLPDSILFPGDETRLSGRQQLRILDNGQRMMDVPEFGLRLGRQLHPSTHGPLGYLALSSPDLLSSLEALRDFLPVRLPLVEFELELGKKWLRCSLQIKVQANADEQRVLQECFALVIQSFAESILGRELHNSRVQFSHRKPAYHGTYAQYLHCPARFSRPVTTFLIPAGLATESNAGGDPESYAQAQDLCRRLLEQVPASALSMADRVRRVLLVQTPGSVSETDVARAMFVSKRTLARRLEREGSSYRRVREQLLAELAGSHLCESGLTVEAVAALLGYNDTAAFRKAFRRWHGRSPSEFRKNPT